MAARNIMATALLGSLLGTLAMKLYPRRSEILEALAEQGNGIKIRSQEYADELLKRGLALAHLRRAEDRGFSWKSGIAGLLLGAAAALLLAPKTGRETRKQVQKLCAEISGKTQKAIRSFDGPGPTPFHKAETLYPLRKAKKVVNKSPSGRSN